MMAYAQFLNIVALAVFICSGCEGRDMPKLIGPFAISDSGEFLFCGLRRDSNDRRYVIVPLKDGRGKPHVLSFPGSDRCHGAMWRAGAHPDELLFVTGGQLQVIKRFRVSNTGVNEISSYVVDPNLLVSVLPGYWSPSGTILALSVTRFERGVSSGLHLGFSKDAGKTISLSGIRLPVHLLWVDDTAFYMSHVVDADSTTGSEVEVSGMTVKTYQALTMTVSKAALNVDSMTAATHEVLQDNNIVLAVGSLNGSLLYAKGDTLFRDSKIFAVMPEKIQRPFVDGGYVAAASADGQKLFILDDVGRIISSRETREKSTCVGISAANRSAYLTALSVADRARIYGYDFSGKSVEVIFEAGSFF